jgi:hypothetical protein
MINEAADRHAAKNTTHLGRILAWQELGQLDQRRRDGSRRPEANRVSPCRNEAITL